MEKEKKKPGYQTRTRNVSGNIRTAGTEQAPAIEAYFVVFGDKYEFSPGCYETIDPAAFDGQLSGDIRALADHDSRLVLGRTTAGTLELRADSRGLWGRITINPDDGEAMNVYSRVKRGDITNCSFGFEILGERKEEEPDGSWHWIVERVKLWEVSVVTFPAYEDTVAFARSAENSEYKRRQIEAFKERTAEKLANMGKSGTKREAEKRETHKENNVEKEGAKAMEYNERSTYKRLASSPLVREFFMEKGTFGEMPEGLVGALDSEVARLSPLYSKVRKMQMPGDHTHIVVAKLNKLEDPASAWISCGMAFPDVTQDKNGATSSRVEVWNIGAVTSVCDDFTKHYSDAVVQMFVLGLARSLVPSIEHAILNGDGDHKPKGIIPAVMPENIKETAKTGFDLYGDLIDYAVLADPELYAGPWEFSAVANRKTLMRLLNTIGSTETRAPAYLPQIMAEITPCESMKDGELLLGYLPAYAWFVSRNLRIDESNHAKFLDGETVYRASGSYDGVLIVNGAFVHVKMTGLGAAE